MRNEPLTAPPFSSAALYIFGHLLRRGGSMRIAPLLRELKLDDTQFADAINELPGARLDQGHVAQGRRAPSRYRPGPFRPVQTHHHHPLRPLALPRDAVGGKPHGAHLPLPVPTGRGPGEGPQQIPTAW